MEKPNDWSSFEKTVSTVRGEVAAGRTYDPARIQEEEAMAQFEVARARMYDIGIVDMMSAIAPLLPGVELKVVDDFDEAGGRGFNPRVTLATPPTTADFDSNSHAYRDVVSGTERKYLHVYPYVHNPNTIDVNIWRQRTYQKTNGEKPLYAGDLRWNNVVYRKEDLGIRILQGVQALNLPDVDLTMVGQVLKVKDIDYALTRTKLLPN